MRHGFRLTEEMREAGFSGGTIKVTDAGHHFDIGEAFTEEGEDGAQLNRDKTIVIDDDILANILSSYPGLERVSDEEIPEDAEAVPSPRQQEYTLPSVVMPPQFQTNDISVGAGLPGVDQGALLAAATEIPAEHADESDTPEGAVAAGEAVSGTGSNQETAVTDYEMPR